MAILGALTISFLFGRQLIEKLRAQQIGETIRDLGLEGQMAKKGTPTMGGLIILAAIVVPVLLFANLGNIYIQLLLLTTVWMGAIGFADDYIKVFQKNKEGLRGVFKVIGQVTLGVIVGSRLGPSTPTSHSKKKCPLPVKPTSTASTQQAPVFGQAEHSLKTTIPFLKDATFDYAQLTDWMGASEWAWVAFILIVIFIITAVSNGANLTDGLDGLAGHLGHYRLCVGSTGLRQWFRGLCELFGHYVHPQFGRIGGLCGRLPGCVHRFLWYNTYPAQVFMGDTGSLSIGAIIAVFAIAVRKNSSSPSSPEFSSSRTSASSFR